MCGPEHMWSTYKTSVDINKRYIDLVAIEYFTTGFVRTADQIAYLREARERYPFSDYTIYRILILPPLYSAVRRCVLCACVCGLCSEWLTIYFCYFLNIQFLINFFTLSAFAAAGSRYEFYFNFFFTTKLYMENITEQCWIINK